MNISPPQAEGLRAPGSGPSDPVRATRKKLPPWDRLKFFIGLGIAFVILVWNHMVTYEGITTIPESTVATATDRWGMVIFILLGLEVLRQIHFLISERSAGYHYFWTKKVFGGLERWSHRRFSDWTRFRLARWIKILFWIVVIAIVLAAVLDTNPLTALFTAPSLVWQVLPYGLQLAFGFFFVIVQFVGLFWFLSRGGIDTYFPDDIKTRFSDVWGQDHVVERVKENIVFLEKPDEIEEKGGYVPSGLLLWGPPGTGKTLMAEAVAGETGKPYVFVDPGAFINMFMGIGILKVKSLFRKLRKLSLRYGGVIVFFDEADSLGSRGTLAQQGPQGVGLGSTPAFATDGCNGFGYLSPQVRWSLTKTALATGGEEPQVKRNRFFMGGMGGGRGDTGTLQALLTELSGLKKPRGLVNRYVRRMLGMRPKPPPNYRILVMMATNMPNSLDEALLRPGRIDRIYKVGYPSKAGRVRTYQGYFAKVKHELTDEQMDKLATITPYYSGAKIKDLVNEALIMTIRDGREVITWQDVIRAKHLKSLGPPEGVEYVERERHATAVHEACHAVMAYRVRHHLEIDIATIEKGAGYLGMVSSIPVEDQFTEWRSTYEADILVSLASLAGERMFFGDDNSSGVSGDLDSATTVAALMETHWGMGSGLSSLPALQRLQIAPGKPDPRRRDAPGIGFTTEDLRKDDKERVYDGTGERIEITLNRLMEKAEKILRENRAEVLAVAHALETYKTLSGDDVAAVIEGTRGTIIDGSVYKDPAFKAKIEEYHDAALRAHLEHGESMLPLPVARPMMSAPSPVSSSVPLSGSAPVMVVQGVLADGTSGATHNGVPTISPPPSLPPSSAPVPAVITPALPATNGGGPLARNGQPEFVPWNGDGPSAASPPPPYVPVEETSSRRSGRGVLVVLAAVIALVALTLLGAAFIGQSGMNGSGFTSPGMQPDGLSTGLLIILLVGVLVVIGGGAIAWVMIRNQQAARARAEASRERAAERAQLLAAAMDPEVAMRLLGYDGRQRPDDRR
ncbi:AAA family ATPase [Thermopolyspora sp. NPDC052614]|uniref:AAA family ATPase n=1 Tax=Thermopolyspora sp. NPDC052614 TaxID=3155682 RepID=UPI00344291E4